MAVRYVVASTPSKDLAHNGDTYSRTHAAAFIKANAYGSAHRRVLYKTRGKWPSYTHVTPHISYSRDVSVPIVVIPGALRGYPPRDHPTRPSIRPSFPGIFFSMGRLVIEGAVGFPTVVFVALRRSQVKGIEPPDSGRAWFRLFECFVGVCCVSEYG